MIRVGILTVSNPVYWGKCEDRCAPLAREWIETHLPEARVELEAMVQQRRTVVQGTLTVWADEIGLDLILTLGGAGPAPQDVAVRATRAVVGGGRCAVPHAAGVRGRTLIVNLPGEPEIVQAALRDMAPFLRDRWISTQSSA